MSIIFDENLTSENSQNADFLTKQALADAKMQKKDAKTKSFNQNIEERKKYAEYIFSFTAVWCLLLFIFLFFIGLGKFHFSDLVITTLIGSTTVNVLVFFKLVTAYLFNPRNST